MPSLSITDMPEERLRPADGTIARATSVPLTSASEMLATAWPAAAADAEASVPPALEEPAARPPEAAREVLAAVVGVRVGVVCVLAAIGREEGWPWEAAAWPFASEGTSASVGREAASGVWPGLV